MPDISTLSLFALACLALTATPGPDMLLLASRSISQGPKAGFASLAGVQAGTYCHAMAAAFGLSQLFVAVPVAYDAVRFTGAIYLLYLGIQAFKSAGTMAVVTPAERRYSTWLMFRQGLLTNILNPKMALFVLALFPQFLKPEAGSVAIQIIVLATILNIIGLIVNGIVIVTVSCVRVSFDNASRFRRLPQILLGSVFVGLAARLAFDGRR